MGTECVQDGVKPSFVIFDISDGTLTLRAERHSQMPIWHRVLYICTDMATVGIRGLIR